MTPTKQRLIHKNLSADQLISHALANGEGVIAANGALNVTTGKRTGRSPKDRYIVRDAITENSVAWGNVNQPISSEKFDALWEKANLALSQKKQAFISYYTVGADKQFAIPVTVMTELAWHQLFTHNLFIRHAQTSLSEIKSTDAWTLLSVPSFQTNPQSDGVNSDAAIILNFTKKMILVVGTYYAGEMKKAMFSVMNFILPEKNVLPMHCAANVGADGTSALFFGLSGTGKTTLSADPERFLIGDDEHGWTETGIFNFEGGCYAKCIQLSPEKEPVIWHAIRENTVMENVVLDPQTLQPNYDDASLTENTRAAYPREHIPLRIESNQAGLPRAVLFLTCDLYGVLPPIARLSREQAAWYFLSGYTALVGSTEVGSGSQIQETFSTCFGAPFFPRPAHVYADLLLRHLDHSGATVWLVNTGWTGGKHGAGGKRFSIPTTRALVSAIVNNTFEKTAEWDTLPGFRLTIPKHVTGVDSQLLDPRKTWQNPKDWAECAKQLIEKFIENFKKFDVNPTIRAAGPKWEECIVKDF